MVLVVGEQIRCQLVEHQARVREHMALLESGLRIGGGGELKVLRENVRQHTPDTVGIQFQRTPYTLYQLTRLSDYLSALVGYYLTKKEK